MGREVVSTYSEQRMVSDATRGHEGAKAKAKAKTKAEPASASGRKAPNGKAWTPQAILRAAFDGARASGAARHTAGLLKRMRSSGQQVACVIAVAACALAAQAEELEKVLLRPRECQEDGDAAAAGPARGDAASLCAFSLSHDATALEVGFADQAILHALEQKPGPNRHDIVGPDGKPKKSRVSKVCEVMQIWGRLLIPGRAGSADVDEGLVSFPRVVGDKKSGTLLNALWAAMATYGSKWAPEERSRAKGQGRISNGVRIASESGHTPPDQALDEGTAPPDARTRITRPSPTSHANHARPFLSERLADR